MAKPWLVLAFTVQSRERSVSWRHAFLQFACNQADYVERQTLLCPCARCANVKQRDAKVVSRHLFLYGFKGNYYVWTSHGEKFYTVGAVKEDVATMKEDFAATRAAITELIQSLRPQANPQQQPPSTQAQDPSTQA
ncbi:hypothetical protein DY000_02008489 [Brassica cretica]|uniref:Transposase-associated domain-containing protein n=1 Tax=Brassica cretica TaxID=69181 RepID=A0ABQ7C2V3_BRACR|nr:hypothetical protein DY000_02008489 [Brassica cretica]